MFLVQTALWMVQLSLLGLTHRSIWLNAEYNKTLKEFDYIEMFTDMLKLGIFSVVVQFLLWLTYQHINIHMN
jgi:hypothetical protein